MGSICSCISTADLFEWKDFPLEIFETGSPRY